MWNCNLELIVAIVGSVGTAIGLIYAFLRNFKNDINGKIERLDGDIKALSSKVDADTRAQTARIDQVNARMDQFQQMFYDLLKAQIPKTNP